MSNQGVCFDIDGMHRTRPHWEYPGGRVLAYNSSVAITGKVCYATADLYNKQSTRLREPSIVAGQAYLRKEVHYWNKNADCVSREAVQLAPIGHRAADYSLLSDSAVAWT